MILKSKELKSGIEYYTFLINAQEIIKPLSEALPLVYRYAPQNRNCKIVNGGIILKGERDLQAVLDARSISPRHLPSPDKPFSEAGIRLYTDPRYYCYYTKPIKSNDLAFNKTKYQRGFIEKHQDVIYHIDKARVLDFKLLTIETPFGTTDINKLSTGCKTLLNILSMISKTAKKRELVNVDECGDNVLAIILEQVENTNIGLFISHDTPLISEEFIEQHRVCLNDNQITNAGQFIDAIWGVGVNDAEEPAI